MATLEVLPDELLLTIFEVPQDSTAEFYALRLVSWRLSNIALVPLYRKIIIDMSTRTLWNIIRTLFSQPTRAADIRVIVFNLQRGDYYDLSRLSGSPRGHELVGQTVQMLSKKLTRSPKLLGHIVGRLSGHDPLNYCASLMLLLDKLENISIRLPSGVFSDAFINLLVDNLYGQDLHQPTAAGLRCLRTSLDRVTVLHIPIQYFSLLSLFSLSRLRSIKIDLFNEVQGQNLPCAPYTRRSALMRFIRSTLSASMRK